MSEISDADWQQLKDALAYLAPHATENDIWSTIGYGLLSIQRTRDARQLWIDFSKSAPGWADGAPEQWWEIHRSQTPRTDYRHIFSMARARGMARVADPAAFALVPEAPEDADAVGAGDVPASDLVSDAPAKPIIRLSGPAFAEIVDQLETVLVPYAYVQGPHLVRETEAHTDATITRASDALMLIRVTDSWMTKKLAQMCTWQSWSRADGGSWVAAGPSLLHIRNLCDQGGWTQLRPLDAIARSPFVRPDGSICDVAGYDRRSRVLYVPSTEFPPIPADPDQDCARGALGRIRAVFDQFPYKEPASEAAFVSHILTEAARVAIDRSPMFFYDAPSAGTGKGLLQEMAARIVHGSDPALRPWVSDGDEIRKVLYASLLSGDRSLWFDNVPDGHKMRSPELCAFITSSTWSDRKLGKSETLGVPNKMVLVASGNNITPTGDLARRSLVVRMDANTERLKERVFSIPLLREHVMAHRPSLLIDALTIIKAYHSIKKSPKMPVTLPSFERWSHFCRDPLIWLGMEDPVVTQKETDDETASLGPVYDWLAAAFGVAEFTANDVARLVNGMTDSTGELANHMMQNGCKEPNSPLKVGYWLRGLRDRISNGLKLVHAGDAKVGKKWKFIKVEEPLT